MKGKELFRDDERAVSPVIGVILMVAITVILAAVIGTFVLNLGGSVQTNVQAGASVTADSGVVTVTWTSNQNADYLSASIDTGCNSAFTDSVTEVGQSMSANCGNQNSAHITVTAHTAEGQSTVIIDKDIEL